MSKQTMEFIMKDESIKIELLDDDNKAYKVTIISYNNSILKFTSPIKNGKPVKLKKGMEIPIQISAHSCVFSSEIKVVAIAAPFFNKDHSKIIISAELNGDITQKSGKYLTPVPEKSNINIFDQKRDNFRLEVEMEMYYIFILSSAGEEMEDTEPVLATLTDVSAGGMCLISQEQFNSEDQLELYFDILDKSFTVTGLILGASETPEGYKNRIRFINFDEGDEKELASTILRYQQLDK
ncbi:hypothetical protein AN396_08855 [Candidatus Epulonipiscium fishelsonii]|uniref:Uncharacterized protein n=1 Tax=Candidatus Epulonipiscium fishelsonii TaxID=77094 RepID=A0ACC8XAC5_9FIRM|nr:hypothetical protein AN396_08855 [Epulopiscium sp. SCG-B11WGA-EpuloA1]